MRSSSETCDRKVPLKLQCMSAVIKATLTDIDDLLKANSVNQDIILMKTCFKSLIHEEVNIKPHKKMNKKYKKTGIGNLP